LDKQKQDTGLINNFTKNDTKAFVWRANYNDDTALWEVDPKTRKESKFIDIDMSKLQSFDLLAPIKEQEDVQITETSIRVDTLTKHPAILTLKVFNQMSIPFFHLELPPGAKLIFARRRQNARGQKIAVIPMKKQFIKVPFPVPNGGTILIIGWKIDNVKALNYIYPNGQIESDYKWREDADHNVVQMPGEEVATSEPEVVNTVSVDANIESNSTTKVGEDGPMQPGIPDDIMQ